MFNKCLNYNHMGMFFKINLFNWKLICEKSDIIDKFGFRVIKCKEIINTILISS